MSDDTTPGPAFPLRDRIGGALTTACPKHSHCNLMGPAVWAIVQPELDQRDAEIADLKAQQLTEARAAIKNIRRWTSQVKAAEATVARVKALAEDMRTWCSPHGIAVLYADRIEEALAPPAPVETDAEFAARCAAAVRERVAKFDPRGEPK